MKARNFSRLLAVCIALCIAGTLCAQGVYWESTTSGGPLGDKTLMSKSYAMPKKFRNEGGNGDVAIVRLDKEKMYILKPKDQTYSEMTFAELEAAMKNLGSQTNPKLAELQEKMKNMPEAQRKIMEKIMEGKGTSEGKDAKIEVQGPGEQKNINGYLCAKYVATSDGKEMFTAWVTKGVKEFESIKKDWQDYSRRMMSIIPMNGRAIAEAYQKIDGFPIETNMMGITTTITKIESRLTPDSAFEVPTTYTKTESPLKKMSQ